MCGVCGVCVECGVCACVMNASIYIMGGCYAHFYPAPPPGEAALVGPILR